ncbi:MAG TPA: type II secretion system F family protein [Pseudonocardiaceae bacterium]|jgi:tight adherence protein B|nr:type II secretion system F family protein [Pseudonocardiaceae bacterium]
MLTLATLALAAAVLIWPAQTGLRRLRAMALLPPSRRPRLKISRPGPVLGIAVLGTTALVIFGPGVAIAVVVAGATMLRRWRARNELRGRITATEGMAQALSGLVAELNAGANTAAAASAVAEDADPESAAVLVAVAGAVRLGGDVDRAVRQCSTAAPHLAGLLRPLAAALTLARRHGLPTAEVLDAVRKDVDGRLRFTKQVQARMAGPRASGTVLAALPLVGIGLGQLMGAAPLRVLLTTGIGQGLLAVGTVLACAGVLWIAKLTAYATT